MEETQQFGGNYVARYYSDRNKIVPTDVEICGIWKWKSQQMCITEALIQESSGPSQK